LNAGGLLDGPEPLREWLLNIVWDGRKPKHIILPLKPYALALQL
jgi:hypothetical protein